MMKRLLNGFLVLSVLAMASALGGCDVTSLNENPNDPSTVTTPHLLTGALSFGDEPNQVGQAGIAATYWGVFPQGYFAMPYAQYWTHDRYTAETRYGYPTERPGSVNNMWENYYLGLNNLQQIIRLNRDSPEDAAVFGPNANQIAIAKTVQAWTFQVMTDIWGPIPYRAALQGSSGRATPAYDAQETIYQGLLDSLSAASEMIDTETPALASGDLLYDGDMAKWKKLANSVKLRVAIRMADVAPDQAQQAAQEALESGVMESNDDNALVPFAGAPPHQNPIYTNYENAGRDDWGVTNTLVDLMKANEDPRLPTYAEQASTGEYIGFPFGLSSGAASSRVNEPFSRPSLRVSRTADAPAIVMLYDEVLFDKAEAAQRWGLGDQSAAQYYEDAIRASMAYWDADDQAAVDAYVASNPYDAANWKHVLGVQKWLALYMQGVQGWSEWRRLDFGLLQPPVAGPIVDLGDLDPQIPVRLSYPRDESTLNEANVTTAVDSILGGSGVAVDDQTTRLWWDVN